MKISRSPKLLVVIAVLLAAAPIWAHHGSAGFDQTKPVHLIGKVSLLDWSNPHIVIHLEVADADGNVATWLINTLPPSPMTKLGYSKSSFALGTDLTVDGYQSKDGSNHVNGTSVAFQDGKKIVTPDCFDNGPFCYQPYDSSKGNGIQ
jgi:hypothetical protein